MYTFLNPYMEASNLFLIVNGEAYVLSISMKRGYHQLSFKNFTANHINPM